MAEYIERESAKKGFNLNFGSVSHAVIANRILDSIPAADVAPVVRCKDCLYYEIGKDYLPYCNHPDGGIWDSPSEDDFCSYGKRKEGNK